VIAACTACEWRGVPTTYGGQRIPGTGKRYERYGQMIFALRGSKIEMRCPRSACRAPIQIVSDHVGSSADRERPEEASVGRDTTQ
jgi:hypothetical protein